MSGLFSDFQRQLGYNSGTLTYYFGIAQGWANSFQVTKETTGTLNGVRLEVSNYSNPATNRHLTDSWAWTDARLTGTFGSNGQASPPPTYLTASSTPASVAFDVGNLNFRHARVILTTGFGDYFKVAWHAKGS
jgi:hypothetical protein